MGCSIQKGTSSEFPSKKDSSQGKSDSVFGSGMHELTLVKKANLFDEYVFVATLGASPYAMTKKVIKKSTKEVRICRALKKARLNQDLIDRIQRDISMMRILEHPNIVDIVSVSEEKKYFLIFMRYYEGGSILQQVNLEEGFYTEPEVAVIMKQIFDAVHYFHSQYILHRDLKPDNIIVEMGDVGPIIKILDVGSALSYDDRKKLGYSYPQPHYTAPEVFDGKLTEKSDIWSCGAIMHMLLSGHPPFKGATETEIVRNIQKGTLKFDDGLSEHLTDACKAFLKLLLSNNPDKRPNAQEALRDPWILNSSGNDIRDVARDALENVKTLKPAQKLQEAIWVYIVTYLASKDQKQDIKRVFQQLDVDEDGKLTKEDLMEGIYSQRIVKFKGCRIFLESDDPEEDVKTLFELIDNNPHIDFEEFLMVSISRKDLLCSEKLQEAFDKLDRNGVGYFTSTDLKELFTPGNAHSVDENRWKGWILEADSTSNGKITFEQFESIMLKLV